MKVGEWIWVKDEQSPAKIVDLQTLWGITTYLVMLPGTNKVISVSPDQIAPLNRENAGLTEDHIIYIAAAARIADVLNSNTLIAPVSSSVIPLPHQLRALARVMSGSQIRYLLADEVGLGKTIEAGLIMRELKMRGRVQRVLVVAPKGLTRQWVAEMHTHFGEKFNLIVPGEVQLSDDNIWAKYAQVVCPMDSIKPMDSRQGWSTKRVAEYNRVRFEDLIAAGWDLIIVDEAHRLGGSSDQVARYRLGQGLADAAPYLLLLSATPHQGKTDAFRRLIALLDEDAFPDEDSVSHDRVKPYLIRTEKRKAVDLDGNPLFKPRKTRLLKVEWQSRHNAQQQLYEAATEYVREGYNRALHEKKRHIGFLMILMQRLVTSSTWAIRATLERRLEVLHSPSETLFDGAVSMDDWIEMDGQEQLETVVTSHTEALRNERAEVEHLLQLARRAEAQSPDAKAEALLEQIVYLQREQADPDLKFLIFTEFVPTQNMLDEFLKNRGFSVVILNGSMDMDERQRVQAAFARDVRILISTDAGGEGLNLQFCHIVINYDIPWNPMRLEQRIGRVDRIGQKHVVNAINFVLEDTVEYRVQEVLESKLAVILSELGIDKIGDVLDSAHSSKMFDDLYVEMLLNPEKVDERVEDVVQQIGKEALAVSKASIMTPSENNGQFKDIQELPADLLSYWIERMTIHYIRANGGVASTDDRVWALTWPDGKQDDNVIFSNNDFFWFPDASQLTLEDRRLMSVVMEPHQYVKGFPIPCIVFDDLPSTICGIWSMWKIKLSGDPSSLNTVFPVFLHDDDRVLTPTARSLWEKLLEERPTIINYIDGTESEKIYRNTIPLIEAFSNELFGQLKQRHESLRKIEQEKITFSFNARHRALQRLGLEEVRRYRLRKLESERQTRFNQIEQMKQIHPSLLPLIFLRVN